MPTDKPRITFALDTETLKAVEDYKYKHRAKNQSQAIISLIEKGLNAIEEDAQVVSASAETKKSPAPEGTEDREKGIDDMEVKLRSLLLSLGLMPDHDLTAEDLEFLAHTIALIQAYFKK